MDVVDFGSGQGAAGDVGLVRDHDERETGAGERRTGILDAVAAAKLLG